MKEKQKPIVEVKNIEIDDYDMTLNLKITAGYNPRVHSPKVTVIFTKENKSRYIPILIQSYYQNVDLETCTIIAEYKYNLSCVFNEPIKDEDVTVGFSLMYGEEYYENLVPVLDGDVNSGEIFKISSNDGIEITRREPYMEEKRNIIVTILRGLIGGIYYILVRIFGIVLLPWLLFDSLMSYFGFKKGHVSRSTRTFVRYLVDNVRVGFKAITREEIGRKNLKKAFVSFAIWMYRDSKIVPNRVTFLSNRRDDLSGNFEDIYEIIKDDKSLDIQMLLDPEPMHRMSMPNLWKFAKLYSTSKVVLVDDFYELTSTVKKKDDVKLIQVWHACGAFKTFGFSRLGKPGGPKQTSHNHRCYDKAIVSSDEIRRFYAEGFGIPLENVVATGMPRTDMFFSETVKKQKRDEFFEKYPKLKDKKIMLFAPTFRGNGRLTGNYPMHKFDLKKVFEETHGEYAILVKMHPFVNNEVIIPEEYKDYIIDFSADSELNDLLFVTDLLITDYSSAVFEASLLSIPMLFYAYDLSEYIATRDFYYEYEPFLPGKIAQNLTELIEDINEENFETEKIEKFRNKFFDKQDGQSSQRVVDLIKECIGN